MFMRRGRPASPVADFVSARFTRWRTGTREGQIVVLAMLIAIVAVITWGSLVDYEQFSVVAYFIPVLLGTLTLRFSPLVVLVALSGVGVMIVVAEQGMTSTRFAALVMMAISALIILAGASRIRSGLPGPLSETMLLDLRDRLYQQGKVPALPDGWQSQSAMKSAGGAKFAGDFMVAGLSGSGAAEPGSEQSGAADSGAANSGNLLEMILVDVCGKGVAAGTQSLHFAGALGGLIGAMEPEELFIAANRFLLRQGWAESFATAIHVRVDLDNGDYSIINAGHPPALRWGHNRWAWTVDGARGTALGVIDDPGFETTNGNLAAGDALLFYTDGVVETHDVDVETGIERLQGVAKAAVSNGFDHAAKRILSKVTDGKDDRAVLILSRDPDNLE